LTSGAQLVSLAAAFLNQRIASPSFAGMPAPSAYSAPTPAMLDASPPSAPWRKARSAAA